jgi:hypothetical protein
MRHYRPTLLMRSMPHRNAPRKSIQLELSPENRPENSISELIITVLLHDAPLSGV